MSGIIRGQKKDAERIVEAQETDKYDTGGISIADLGQEAEDIWAKLTVKQRAVVCAYFETGNPGKAYIKVTGYSGSASNAGRMGRAIIGTKRVAHLIEAWRKAVANRFKVSDDKILRTYAHLAFADIRDFFNEDGSFKAIKDLPRECADMIAGFDVEELFAGSGKDRVQIGITKKIRLINRKDALDSLAKTRGLFVAMPKDKEKQTEARVVKMPNKPVSVEEWQKKHGNKKA